MVEPYRSVENVNLHLAQAENKNQSDLPLLQYFFTTIIVANNIINMNRSKIAAKEYSKVLGFVEDSCSELSTMKKLFWYFVFGSTI